MKSLIRPALMAMLTSGIVFLMSGCERKVRIKVKVKTLSSTKDAGPKAPKPTTPKR